MSEFENNATENLYLVNLLEDYFMKELPDPFPLSCRSSQDKFRDVKVIDQQGLSDPVDHHGDRSIGVGDLENLLDVLPVRHHVHIRKTVDKVICYPETGEARVYIWGLIKTCIAMELQTFCWHKVVSVTF